MQQTQHESLTRTKKKSWYKRWYFWVIIAVVLIGGGLVKAMFFSAPKTTYTTEKVQRTDVKQMVSVTGQVSSDDNISLNFSIAGTLARVNAKVGDQVKLGQVLAELDSKDQAIAVQQAQAALGLAQANLNQKIVGATPEDIAISRATLNQTKIDLTKAQNDYTTLQQTTQDLVRQKELAVTAAQTTLDNSQTSAEQSLTNYYSQAYTSISSAVIKMSSGLTESDNILGVDNSSFNDSFESVLAARNGQTLTMAKDSYTIAKIKYNNTKTQYNSTPTTYTRDQIDGLIITAKAGLQAVHQNLSDTRTVLDNTLSTSGFTESTLSTYKSNIDTANSAVNTALNSLETIEQNISTTKLTKLNNQTTYQNALDTAEQVLAGTKVDVANQLSQAKDVISVKQSMVDSAQSSLDLRINRPREIDIAGLRAQLAQAQASLNLALANLDKTKLLAPSEGLVTDVKNDVGENVMTTSDFITMISPQLKIEADVSETDIVKVKLNDQVEMTFDALGYDQKFKGEVIKIDPAPTEISGVVYYKTTIILSDKNTSIKPGMTANLEIMAANAQNVLAVPFRAVKNKTGGSKYVQILENGQPKDVDVEIGLEGESMIEIKGGLSEGQDVITFVKTGK